MHHIVLTWHSVAIRMSTTENGLLVLGHMHVPIRPLLIDALCDRLE